MQYKNNKLTDRITKWEAVVLCVPVAMEDLADHEVLVKQLASGRVDLQAIGQLARTVARIQAATHVTVIGRTGVQRLRQRFKLVHGARILERAAELRIFATPMLGDRPSYDLHLRK